MSLLSYYELPDKDFIIVKAYVHFIDDYLSCSNCGSNLIKLTKKKGGCYCCDRYITVYKDYGFRIYSKVIEV